jgi:ATP-dependent Clp protease ATP-binding subunit ClpX
VDNAMASRDVSGKGVQQNLLKIIEGTDVQISNKKNPHQEQIIINTSSIFVVAGGAFQGLNQIIRQSMKKLFSLGFMSKETHSNYKNPEVISDEQTEIMKHFNREHLVSFGMIPELVGRFECISVLNKLTENQLVEILRDKHDNVMEEYSKIFSLHNVQLTFDDKFLRAVAKKAMLENTGARALRSIIHKIFSSIIFTMPTLCNDKNKKYILHMSEEQVTGKETARIVEEITPSYTQAVQ